MSNFNAKVGSDVQLKGIIGVHGLGERNERGLKLVDICASNGLAVSASPKAKVHVAVPWC